MKTISKLALGALIAASCSNNRVIAPAPNPITPIIQSPIIVDFRIRILNVDSANVTNLVNGLGYVYKSNGNWIQVVKFGSMGGHLLVHQGEWFKGQFIIPSGLSDLKFQSQMFLLSNGVSSVNPQNVVTLQVWANNTLVVDRRPNGFDSTSWNYGRYDISTLVPLTY